MSVINRFDVANILNLHGEKATQWDPMYRHEAFDLRAQPAAIQIPNGGGKTTISDALFGMIVRDPTLMNRTRGKMAPAKSPVMSHIRVEFLQRGDTVGQGDMLTDAGERPNGETWVFGMCGRQGKNEEMIFYYYPGSLEDYPLSERDNQGIHILDEGTLAGYRKIIPNFQWKLGKADWLNAIKNHVSLTNFRQMAEFQKRGGGDKSQELFAVKKRQGESFDQAFFYDVLAPELLAGIMDKEGEEDEHDFEQTITNSVQKVITAKRNTEKRRQDLSRAHEAVKAIEGLATAGEKAIDADTTYRNRLAKLGHVLQVLQRVSRDQPIPGIPMRENLPEDFPEWLIPHIAIEPGRGWAIKDAGLAELTGMESRRLNERAAQVKIKRSKPSHVVDFTDDNKLDEADLEAGSGEGRKESRRQNRTVYGLAEAERLLDNLTTLQGGYAKDDIIELLESLEAAFPDFDTNPLRVTLTALEEEIDSDQNRIEELAQKISDLQERKERLQEEAKEQEAIETAYNDLRNSNRFSEAELADPLKTWETAVNRLAEAREGRQAVDDKTARLRERQPYWETFAQQHGQESDPNEVKAAKQDQEARLKEQADEVDRESETKRVRRKELESTLETDVDPEIRKTDKTVEWFAEQWPFVEQFRELFPEEEPDGLTEKVKQERDQFLNAVSRHQEHQKNLQAQVESWERFRREIADRSPTEWLRTVNDERQNLRREREDLTKSLKVLRRKRKALETDPIAPSEAAQEAMDRLSEQGLNPEVVHTFVDSLGLPDERRKLALSILSALLFAPVFGDANEAAQAAHILEEADLQVPVFLAEPLADYLREGDLSQHPDLNLVEGVLSGRTTWGVSCLLDPQLVEREKGRLDEQIEEAEDRITEIDGRLAIIDPEGETVRLAEEARRAEEADAPGELERVKEQLANLEAGRPRIEQRSSDQAQQAIRSALAFNKAGGENAWERAQAELDRLQRRREGTTDEIAQLDEAMEQLRETARSLRQEAADLWGENEVVLLDHAATFLKLGGEAFLDSAEDQKAEWQAIIDYEDARTTPFGHGTFERAKQYVDQMAREEQGRSITEEINAIKSEINAAKTEKEQRESAIAANQERLPQIRQSVQQIDDLAAQAVVQYHTALPLFPDIAELTEVHTDERAQAVAESAEALQGLIARNADEPDILAAVDGLQEALDQLDLRQQFWEMRGARKEFRSALAEFEDLRGKVVSDDDLTLNEVERATIREHIGLEGARKAMAIADQLNATYEEARQTFEETEKAEKESRETVAGRLVWFIYQAQTNLTLLRQVARKQHSNLTAYFEVSADMVDKEEAHTIINRIIERFDAEMEAHEKRKKAAGAEGESEEEHRRNLNQVVRELSFRSIFKNPRIRYQNEAIRPRGGLHDMDLENLSQGQKTALSLMWRVRLAEFAVEREVRRQHSTAARKKVRQWAEDVLIIDGLFSDLSDPDLIETAMRGIEQTHHHFQLIGLIHNPYYQNRWEVFPTYLVGRRHMGRLGRHGWVSIEDGGVVAPESEGLSEGEMQMAHIHRQQNPMETHG